MAAVPDFELQPAQVVVQSFAGFGAQFNQHVYAGITAAPLGQWADLEEKVAALRPQLVRIFYNDAQEGGARDKLESFVLAAELAHRVGATINVTWQSGGVDEPAASMTRFAVILGYLAGRGITSLRWVTIQNEPNSTAITPAQNLALYKGLDARLRAAGLREQIRFMGGDLVEDDQRAWFEFMAARFGELLDAYSVHVYWDFDDTAKLERRLADVQAIVRGLPAAGRRPVYASEFGIRGHPASGVPPPGVYTNGTPIARTNVAAFQHAWFQLQAARLGFAGTVRWDCFAARYDRGVQAYSLIGPFGDGWPLYPSYRLLRLFTTTVEPGCRVVGLAARSVAARDRRAAAFLSDAGGLTILGLDTAGATVNTVSRVQVPWTLAGLPPGVTFTLRLWNADGKGQNQIVARPVSDRTGVVSFQAPRQSVFALSGAAA